MLPALSIASYVPLECVCLPESSTGVSVVTECFI